MAKVKVPAERPLTRLFFEAWAANKPDNVWFYLWSMWPPDPTRLDKQGKPYREKTTHWANSIDSMVGLAAAADEKGCDVYFGCSFAREKGTTKERIKSVASCGICALWLDIDYLSPKAHQKTDLPPDIESAYALTNSMPLPPSLVVESGNGLQAWWLFNQPLVFLEEKDRLYAERLLQGWNLFLVRKSSEKRWQADSVGALSWVMRVPGTSNHKSDPAKPVIWDGKISRRYEPKEFEPWMSDEVMEGFVLGGNVTIDPSVALPDKFHNLHERSRKFAKSWAKDRPDLKDQSTSGYDMSLASLSLGAGFTDQEATDLMICFARRHNAQIKDDRYYRFTIAKAKANGAAEGIIPPERLMDIEKAIGEVYGAQHEDEKQEKINDLLTKVNDELGVKIVRVVRYPASGPNIRPSFRLYFPGAIVHFANASEMSSQPMFWGKLLDQKITSGKPKKKGWENLIKAIVRCSEDELADVEAVTSDGIGRALVRDYLTAFPPAEDPLLALPQGGFRRGSLIYFYSSEISSWAANARRQFMSPQELGIYLRDAGCSHKNIRNPRNKKQGWMWIIEEGLTGINGHGQGPGNDPETEK